MLDRAAIEAKREIARQKADAAKRAAMSAREALKNPPPKFITPINETGDIEKDYAAEGKAIATGFLKRAKDEGARFRAATDSEYWAAICFQTREQKEAFLAALGILAHGDKYLDGRAVAEALGIVLPVADVPYNASAKRDTSWDEFVD
ncbi:MAG TPA: hypothetical protein VFP92_10790 [Rhodanobacteraceae bacterium]|nr:hypothetical protein [Rhodanobacteraceae bacterium]